MQQCLFMKLKLDVYKDFYENKQVNKGSVLILLFHFLIFLSQTLLNFFYFPVVSNLYFNPISSDSFITIIFIISNTSNYSVIISFISLLLISYFFILSITSCNFFDSIILGFSIALRFDIFM